MLRSAHNSRSNRMTADGRAHVRLQRIRRVEEPVYGCTLMSVRIIRGPIRCCYAGGVRPGLIKKVGRRRGGVRGGRDWERKGRERGDSHTRRCLCNKTWPPLFIEKSVCHVRDLDATDEENKV